MQIEIICTGDEVLTGKIVNTNFSYMSQKLEDFGLSVKWETTVGDDRNDLLQAFQLASQRADAVIVNGGLGPTVDDLSQEVAAQAAGVNLVLHEEWAGADAGLFSPDAGGPCRKITPNRRCFPRGQSLSTIRWEPPVALPSPLAKRAFSLPPGVPRELRRMLENEILPRLLTISGSQVVLYLKRFHSYGLGESHVDAILNGVEDLAPDGSVKLGFRAHYPQLETKLMVRGTSEADIQAKLAPVEAEVHRRMGNYILAEDNDTLEGVVLQHLNNQNGTLVIVETFTGGQIAARIVPLPGANTAFRRGVVSLDLADIYASIGINEPPPDGSTNR